MRTGDFVVPLEPVGGVSGELEDENWRLGSTKVVRERAFWSWTQKWRGPFRDGLRSGQFVAQMWYGKERFGAGLRSGQFVVQK